MVETSDSKLRKMEEEMTRFEAEIASQTPQVSVPATSLHYSQPISSYSMPYVPGSQFASPGLMPANQYMATPTTPGIYMPPNYSIPPAFMPPPASTQPVIQAQPTVISAPPQMAAPSQLAAAVRANREAEAAAKLAAAADAFDVDDDVTRALLAAAAGVTYNHQVAPSSSLASTPASATASTASDTKSATATPATKVVPSVPSKTVVVPQSLLPTQLSSSTTSPSQRGASRLTLLDTSVAPPMRSKASLTEEPYSFQKKVYKRVAAGMVWEDPTLSDWDPNDFRIFCGDLGNEVSDDTLIRAFSRYPSFRKAKVIVDKRTGKSRGYGFVSFSDPNDFTRAMREMNGKYVGNRPIKLKKSDWRNRQLETYRKKEKEKKRLGLRL
ncbi:RNA-binding protein 42 [Echinococcus granulosus]|uniref:RNA-binding protein 42 n=1 Tax=Echinococcus granulosus TaxID=6210 RepID=U6JQM1_ECHGR|nr:RNA-binding protein 42 [Echinococcus granulosus]EUB55796.1 RNA-binding protein 42 [Echinococcus granulosus]KAH9283559.1 RNA-binding protein 42 [Echinococcus granulosus]CDS24192.1 RNA binding protein 42 [Echinococcus granulosus]